MKKYLLLLTLSLLNGMGSYAYACTSAIIAGRLTSDGRPLMWKHRDTDELNNRMEYFKAGPDRPYAFTGLVDSPHKYNRVWAGTNEKGFSIMNTATYNLQDKRYEKGSYAEISVGLLMYTALGHCASLADLEHILDTLQRPIGLATNLGVIDAHGGAAYYEVNNDGWIKLDVNDPKVAPQGYLLHSNYSFTGYADEGLGYIRYASASKIFQDHVVAAGKFSPDWIFENLSRHYYHALLNVDLNRQPELAPNGWYVDQDFILRKSTSAVVVIQGVLPGENPLLTVFWTLLGYPTTGIVVPLMVAAGKDLPAVALCRSKEDPNCDLCDAALRRKADVYPLKRGNGEKYFNLAVSLQYKKQLLPVEENIRNNFLNLFHTWREKGKVSEKELIRFYESQDYGLSVGL